MKREWKEVTYELNEERLKLHVYPYIGNKNIPDVKISDILKIVQKLQLDEHFETSERILNTIERIYKYAVTYGFVEHNIIADIDKRTLFTKRMITHRASLTKENEIRELMQDINPIESKSSNYEDIVTFKYVADKWYQKISEVLSYGVF